MVMPRGLSAAVAWRRARSSCRRCRRWPARWRRGRRTGRWRRGSAGDEPSFGRNDEERVGTPLGTNDMPPCDPRRSPSPSTLTNLALEDVDQSRRPRGAGAAASSCRAPSCPRTGRTRRRCPRPGASRCGGRPEERPLVAFAGARMIGTRRHGRTTSPFMGLKSHDETTVPSSVMSTRYELNGRIAQKRRTRDALVAAARDLVAQGLTPTVEAAAEAASISRTTAYRYFPNQRALLAAAHPETVAILALPDDAPDDAATRSTSSSMRSRRSIARHRSAAAHDASALTRGRSRRACAAPAAARPRDQVDRGSTRAAPQAVVRSRGAPPRPRHPQRHRDRSAGVADRRR